MAKVQADAAQASGGGDARREPISADFCIIGAGSGGLSLAAAAVAFGQKVVLIEKHKMGGDCLNYGCVPSKALIAAGKRAHIMRTSAPFGIQPVEPRVDPRGVHEHVHSVIEAIAPNDSVERFAGLGVRVITAAARFIDKETVAAGEHLIKSRYFVVATGSAPVVPPIPGLADVPYFTNETIFDNAQKLPHLIVIGGGPIGVELAQAHRRLGSGVTIVEADTLLNRDDPEAVEIVRTRLKKEGVALREKSKAARVEKAGDRIRLTLDDGETVLGSNLLIAVGRRANLAGLSLDKAGVALDGGKLRLDARLRTTNRRVYAIGDAAGGLQFTHVAGDHASTLVKNILFKAPATRRDALAPRVTYCSPEVASVGVSESEAQKSGVTYSLARWALADNDRARAERDTQGFIKALIGKGGRILGATIVGAGAGDLIGPWALAVANNLKIRVFTNMIAPYPTRSEISKRAAGAYYTPALFSARTRRLIGFLAAFD